MKKRIPVTIVATIATTLSMSGIAAVPNNNDNVWKLIASQVQVSSLDQNARVKHWVNFYTKSPSHRLFLEEVLKRATPYIRYIYKEVKERKMPVRFALLPIVESSYKPKSVSNVGAAGLWQLMRTTAPKSYGIEINRWYDGRLNIVKSTSFALNYLKSLHEQFGTWPLAAAAYNDGPGNIHSAIRHNKRLHKPTDFWNLRLPKQTRDYIPKIRALAIIISNPSKYGVKVPYTPNKPYFKAVKINKQITKRQIKKFADVSTKTIHKLDPNLRSTATRPKHPVTLLLPADKVTKFKKNFLKASGKAPTVVKV